MNEIDCSIRTLLLPRHQPAIGSQFARQIIGSVLLVLCNFVDWSWSTARSAEPNDQPTAANQAPPASARQAPRQPAIADAPELPADESFFRQQIAPLLEKRCLACHNSSERKGGLSLETAASARAGGQSGPSLVPGDAESSYLLDLVTPQNGQAEMPRESQPLSSAEVAALRRWVAAGAAWPEGYRLQEPRVASANWWSLADLNRPPVPQIAGPTSAWIKTPVDAFVLEKLAAAGMTPSVEADRRTLIRRLYFDLIGLPPEPEQMQAALADGSADWYEQLVERLLASPHHGERWARHWLDVVHYGDTHGYDKDKPRPNAWPYRDYVIRSFNADKPYARFVQEQIAGDVLFPGTAEGIEALGFIAAGPWDFIGHAEVPETKIDGQIARHLDRDDMVSNTINTFCSLTVQCAQCHNHKFDPIVQADYYRLQAVFSALDRADRTYYADPAVAARAQSLQTQRASLEAKLADLKQRVHQQAGPELVQLEQKIAAAQQASKQPAPGFKPRPEFGYHSQIARSADVVKWVQVDLGESIQLAQLELIGCHDNFNHIGAGFGFPVRYKIELSDDPAFQHKVTLAVDRTSGDVPNPGTRPQRFDLASAQARYIRLTATRLALRQNDYILAVGELRAWDRQGRNRALGATVTALDSIEAPVRWRRQNLVDGYAYGQPEGEQPPPATSADQAAVDLAAWEKQRQQLWETKVDAALRRQLEQTTAELTSSEQQLAQLPPPQRVYVGTVYQGTGSFRGTGADQGRPRPIYVLRRGDVRQHLEEVQPGSLSCVSQLPAVFDLPAEAPEGQRRAALAGWLTDRRNPLVWRSIVNRMWRYHFGRGLVNTPNDFGRMGELPTHPELLDWLAVEFRDSGQSLKQLHRLLVTSAVYRQTSAVRPELARRDTDNTLWWRMNRRRLEAEAIRDAVLAVSGQLDPTPFGPGFQDFVIEKPAHSPHYEYDLYDPDDPRSHRRSIYRFLVRSQQQPFMTTLDCADPSMLVDKRNETLSPLQALGLLNNGFMLCMARHFGQRVEGLSPDLPGQVQAAFRLAVSREPTADELKPLVDYARRHGLANTCRLLFNLNEFVFVD